MGSFRDKLDRLAPVVKMPAPPVEEDSVGTRLDRARELLQKMAAAQEKRPPASAGSLLASRLSRTARLPAVHSGKELPGAVEETPHGPVHFARTWLQPADTHGVVRAASALEASSTLVAELALDPVFDGVDLSRMLLIDTETTGLSTAAGTVAFLIGVAFFEDESLCVEQLVLTKLGHERPMLEHLADRIRNASCIVSYNGKSFDWPLLRTRYVMNRVPTPPIPPHLDLLHCARRVFKKRLDRVRLVDMERELLGFVREHDVSGAEIPGIYLRFLRTADPGRLDGVLEHNGHDLVALAAILGELARRFQQVRREDDPRDHLAFARVAERAGDMERAEQFATAAAEGGGNADNTLDALLVLARTAKRGGLIAAEQLALQKALEAAPPERRAFVHLELSKMYERRQKRTVPALVHALHTAAEEDEEPRDRRVHRLTKRLAKQNRKKPLRANLRFTSKR